MFGKYRKTNIPFWSRPNIATFNFGVSWPPSLESNRFLSSGPWIVRSGDEMYLQYRACTRVVHCPRPDDTCEAGVYLYSRAHGTQPCLLLHWASPAPAISSLVFLWVILPSHGYYNVIWKKRLIFRAVALIPGGRDRVKVLRFYFDKDLRRSRH